MPSLVERSPDGGYIIPQLYVDDGYTSMSNKSSPAKVHLFFDVLFFVQEIQTLNKWPETSAYGLELSDTYSPISPMLKSQYGFNAFMPSHQQSKASLVINGRFIFSISL